MNRIYYLDGLRGLACLMVVFSHFLFAFYPAAHIFKLVWDIQVLPQQ